MKTIIILAGNHKEYLNCLFSVIDSNPSNVKIRNGYIFVDDIQYVYGSRPEAMQGIRADDLMVYGTFWERKDAGDLYKNACCRIFIKTIG